MKLTVAQLAPHLQKNLSALYWVAGDEPFLVQEALAAIRSRARAAGFTERTVITAETGTEWEQALYADTHDISLFAPKKIVELDLSAIKITAAAGKVLADYAERPVADVVLMIQTAKLDLKTEKSSWYAALEQHAMVVTIWPVLAAQLPQWLIQQAKKMHLTLSPQAAEKLAQRVEGNLLAAAQELEKLSLLQPNGTIDHHVIEEKTTDNAHYDIFNLVESALAADLLRCLRILHNLAAEKTEPTLVLWALTRELRLVADIQGQLQKGMALPQVFNQFRIWEKRQIGLRAYLQRHSQQQCWQLLVNAGKIDRIIKGIDKGNPWDALQQFTLEIAGNVII